MNEGRERLAAVGVPVPVERALDRRVPQADVGAFAQRTVDFRMNAVLGRDQARGAPGTRQRACSHAADADVRERFGGARGLSFALLVQRRVWQLIALVSVSLRFAMAHEDEP